jgi:type I restriction enzyme, S subunit
MALTGGTIGKIIKAVDINELLLQNYRVGNFYPKSDNLNKEFLFYVLSADLIIAQIFYYQKETGQPNVGKEDFSNMKFCLPPAQEQTAIVHYIETETTKINDKINLIKQEIELLKEYRQALIFEAVTGKIRVH